MPNRGRRCGWLVAEATLAHRTRNVDITVGTSVATSTSLSCGDVAGGIVIVSGVTASATLTIHAGNGTTFAPVYDASGAAATLVVPASGGAAPLPDAVYPARYLKVTSDSELGTGAAVVVMLKS